MDSAYGNRNKKRKLEFCENGHTFNFPPDQLPKHKIFISHSGKQKDFAEQLCEDLETWGYYPFFDKRQHSLPKGENFPSLIFKATRECFLAILLLSEEFFTKSKWPMLELASFVHAQKTQEHLRILPVLLDLHIGDLKDTARWSEHWKNWGNQDNRLDCKEWETAVKSLGPVNMLMKSSYDGEVALRKEIVKVVLSMMPPDIQSDVAHVQGRERLYKEIVSKISNIPTSCSKLCENAKVLGVYGIGGVGKSTLCMILTHFLRREFQGRVCHVELDEGVSTVKLQCRALKQLTGANQDYLNMHINTKEEGMACLKERIPRQRVFLALDNVSDIPKSMEAAIMFLRLKFHPDSVVLVASRSRDVLHRSLGIPESCCMLCPHVTAEEALKIVLDHINVPSTGNLNEEQGKILRQTLELCNFGGFHPLSLKVLASQMGSNPSLWRLSDLNLQESSDIEHPLFSAIETNFLRLPDQQTRDIFMDIALFCPESVNSVHDVCMWLSDTLHSNCDVNHIKKKLHNLRLKSLVEVWSMDADIVRIHDIHVGLAKRKARVEEISDGNPPRFVYQSGDKVASKVFSIRQRARHIERAGFVESSFTTLSFKECSCLQLLCVRRCEKLATLSLHGLLSLVSLELSSCPVEILNLEGLVNLRWLCVDSCGKLMELDASGLKDLTCVRVSRCIDLEDLKLANTDMLKSLSVSYNSSLEHVDLGSGRSLHCLTLWFCEILARVDLCGSVYLSEFKKRGCPQLLNIQGCNNASRDVKCLVLTRWHNISSGIITALEGSMCLQVLDLWDCPVSRLPDLRGCANLRELRLSDLDILLDSDDTSLLHEYADILCAPSESLGLPVSLQDLQIASCRNVVVKEVCWKLQGLKNLVVLSMQRVRVAWDWELYTSIEQKGSNVSFQAYDKISSDSELESLNEVLHTDIDINSEAEIVSGGEERSSFDKGATMMNLEIFNCSCQIMYWVHEYLDSAANGTHLERELKKEVQFYWEMNMGKPLMAVSEDIGSCWERMAITSDQIRKLQYGIIERTLLETCNSCDTICEQFFQRSNVADSVCFTPENADEFVNVCQRVAAEDLKRKLYVLNAISPQQCILMHDYLETWEDEIIDELATYEKVRAFGKTEEKTFWENSLMGEGIISKLPRVETFAKRLDELESCRGWELHMSNEVEGVKQWRRDWLQSCKIGILIEQLIILQARGVVAEGGGCGFQWLWEMMKAIDYLLQSEWNKRWSQVSMAPGTLRKGGWLEGMLRGWKTRQWLQALASCLSEDLIQENRRVTDEEMQSNNQEFKEMQSINQALASSTQPLQASASYLSEILIQENRGVTDETMQSSNQALASSIRYKNRRVTEEFKEMMKARYTKLRYEQSIDGLKDVFALAEASALHMKEKQKMVDLHPNANRRDTGKEMELEEMKNAWGKVERKADDLQEESLYLELLYSVSCKKNKEWVVDALPNLSKKFTAERMAQKERISLLYKLEGIWGRALELATKLAELQNSRNRIFGREQQKSYKTAEMMEREMKDIWEWGSFGQRMYHVVNIEHKLMQISKEAVAEIRQNPLSMINDEEEEDTPEESAFCDTLVTPEEDTFVTPTYSRLIQHFQFMDQLLADETAKLKLLLMRRAGKMRALMMPGESSSDQQKPKVLKEDELQMWRRAGKFQYFNINVLFQYQAYISISISQKYI